MKILCNLNYITKSIFFVFLLAAFISLGRLTVPGHALTGWPGFYEAMAHIGLGVMIGAAIWVKEFRWLSIILLVALSAQEVYMFMHR